MRIDGRHTRTFAGRRRAVVGQDQTKLPHRVEIVALATVDDAARAIADMIVRGAPLIGVTGAYGFALATVDDASDSALDAAYSKLLATRPTASNLRWALDRMRAMALATPVSDRQGARVCRESGGDRRAGCRARAAIGIGAALIQQIAARNPPPAQHPESIAVPPAGSPPSTKAALGADAQQGRLRRRGGRSRAGRRHARATGARA